MNWKRKLFLNSRLYAVTQLVRWDRAERQAVEDACRGGIDVLQLRSKTMEKDALIQAGKEIRKITQDWNVLFIVNDDPYIAVETEADGVHLGQDDTALQEARRILGSGDWWIGKSTHTIEQALSAEEEGADYIGIGPLFRTPTKPGYQPIGLDWLGEAVQAVQIPSVAIGGIESSNVLTVLEAGAERVAVVRAIFGAEHVCAAAKALKSRIQRFFEQAERHAGGDSR